MRDAASQPTGRGRQVPVCEQMHSGWFVSSQLVGGGQWEGGSDHGERGEAGWPGEERGNEQITGRVGPLQRANG